MPAWRNWQTRWTQNPVPVEGVSVRPRSPVLRDSSEALSTLRSLHIIDMEAFLFAYNLHMTTGSSHQMQKIPRALVSSSAY